MIYRRVTDGSLTPSYSDEEILKQIDFQLNQHGKGYQQSEKMLQCLKFERSEFFNKLEEIADGDGNIDMNELRDFVDYYRVLFKEAAQPTYDVIPTMDAPPGEG